MVRGQIIASNLGYETSSTSYLFVKIADVAEPGIGKDITSGDLMTEAAALEAVSLRGAARAEAFVKNISNSRALRRFSNPRTDNIHQWEGRETGPWATTWLGDGQTPAGKEPTVFLSGAYRTTVRP